MTIPAWLKRLSRRHGFPPARPFDPRPFRPVLEPLETRRLPSTYVVTNTNDSGSGSLRQAILNANADQEPVSSIVFQIPGSGRQQISPTSALPVLSHPTVLDATSQPTYAGSPMVVLDGARAGDVDGLTISAGQSTVAGLVISHFRSGIVLQGGGSNTIQENYIGTDATGTTAQANRADGITIRNGSSGNVITGNVISGNGASSSDQDQSGVLLAGADVTGNYILGNYLGTDPSGSLAVGNSFRGVYLRSGASDNAVWGNVISGNPVAGVQIDDGSGNLVQANLIGTDATGAAALPNGWGVAVNRGSGNAVGGADWWTGNIISGNNAGGVSILGSAGNLIQGNFIGVDAGGAGKLGNGTFGDGIFIHGAAPDNLIAANVIAGDHNGIWIDGAQATGNQVQDNLIGTDASGSANLGNTNDGVLLSAPGNTIGGTIPGTGNVIAGSNVDGITVFQTTNTLVQGNLIGTDRTGTVALPNLHYGVDLAGSSATPVQGTAVVFNIISGNRTGGVYVANGNHNEIQSNYIGVDASGVTALPNVGSGVTIQGGWSNTVNAADGAGGNIIGGNTQAGVLLNGSTVGNVVQGNLIGVGVDGVTPVGNRQAGVLINGSAQGNLIGGVLPGNGNLIANTTAGPGVSVTLGPGNSLRENAIYGNSGKGIALSGSGAPNLPVLTSAAVTGQGVVIQGTYAGSPTTAYALEFFANDQADDSGNGEGQYYLGTQTVVTNAAGQASFTAEFTVPVSPGQFISATATTPTNTTSEFAHDVVASSPPGVRNDGKQLAARDAAFQDLGTSVQGTAVGHAALAPLPGTRSQPAPQAFSPAGLATAWAGLGRSDVGLGRSPAISERVRDAAVHSPDWDLTTLLDNADALS